MSNNSPEFSFNLYPELDADLEAVYERNVALGLATEQEETSPGLISTVKKIIESESRPYEPNLSQETLAWAHQDIVPALKSWYKYRPSQLVEGVPLTIDQMLESNSHLAETLSRLHAVKEYLKATHELTPEGKNIGETMHLVLMPWQAIRSNLSDFSGWMNSMRDQQGTKQQDYINPDLLIYIQNDMKLYIRSAPGSIQKPSEYLDDKIKQDGPWGVMLVQTSNEAGLKSLIGKSPNDLTNNGAGRLKFASFDVDSLGIFEWLALTLQEDPNKLSSKDYSWLLANRLMAGNSPQVPCGRWLVSRVRSFLDSPDYDDAYARPRLAVI